MNIRCRWAKSTTDYVELVGETDKALGLQGSRADVVIIDANRYNVGGRHYISVVLSTGELPQLDALMAQAEAALDAFLLERPTPVFDDGV